MLATFVIGLREGLEAALIVSIIGAFLRKNGRSLVPMWIGVGTAVLLSIGVGVGLKLVESSLNQQAQERMETVIGAVAVFFVTGMILWMAQHSRGMKRDLEAQARDALGDGTSKALIVMAFLAVLKEGFETAVFLLATLQGATNGALAGLGAFLGIAASIVLGYGIYTGGVSLNLGKFFKATSIFLVLVAAGLVVSALRTAHEAGWLNALQQRTIDLTWLTPNGSIRSALLTGVLGIPTQPRLAELLGWFAYLVPMLLILFTPARLRPNARGQVVLKLGIAGVAVIAAAVLALVAQPKSADVPATAALDGGQGSVTLRGSTLVTPSGDVTLTAVGDEQHGDFTATHLVANSTSHPASAPATLTSSELVVLNGGRIPVGVDAARAPGPYTATWAQSTSVDVWRLDGGVLDARKRATTTLTLSGGGLGSARTLVIPAGTTLPGGTKVTGTSWAVAPGHVTSVAEKRADARASYQDRRFLSRVLPVILLLIAAWAAFSALRTRRALAAVGSTGSTTTRPSELPSELASTPASASDSETNHPADATRTGASPASVSSPSAIGTDAVSHRTHSGV